jgi:hypothetical protein
MEDPMSNALTTILHRLRSRPDQQWSRLDRTLPTPDLPTTQAIGLEDHPRSDTDSAELRNYLAAQTSQVV